MNNTEPLINIAKGLIAFQVMQVTHCGMSVALAAVETVYLRHLDDPVTPETTVLIIGEAIVQAQSGQQIMVKAPGMPDG